MNQFSKLAAALLLCAGTGQSLAQENTETQLTATDMNALYQTAGGSVTSIHDPSVVFHNGHFYIWGTHLGHASSADLINYNWIGANNNTWRRLTAQGATTGSNVGYGEAFNIMQVTKVKNSKGEMVSIPNIDGEKFCSRYGDANGWIGGNMWAPDIIYNKKMKKWCMYLSLNGDHWASAIILLTASNPSGPFTYQAPVVMGGFNGQSYNGIAAPTIGETDYTIATGETSINSRYLRADWGTFWPNCIDPCVFYDEDGQLWMSYGSWSGGIFMLKLDEETGLRDYTYTYPSDYAASGANGVSDPYFGKKIAGGYYVSGEGSYIQHIGQYYYLFVTYGGLEAAGGYEMRVFRSSNPTGPYVDASGESALYRGYALNYGKGASTNRGCMLMTCYNHWGNQDIAMRAQGHNSACQDDKGRSFIVYHTRFNNGNEGHQVRTQQLYVNEKGWLVVAPFIYRGENNTDEQIASEEMWSSDDIVGDYHVLMHRYRLDNKNLEEIEPETITLAPSGKITGDYTGTWKLKSGTCYITLTVGGQTYYGVLTEQEVNGATANNYQCTTLKALCISAMANNGQPLWAYKLQPKYAVAYTYKNATIAVKPNTTYNKNINLHFPTYENTTLTWTSTEPDVISETGKYNPQESIVSLKLTGRLQCGSYFWEQTYSIKAAAATTPAGDYRSGMVAYYDMDELPCRNAYDETQSTTLSTNTSTRPGLITDLNRFGKQIRLKQASQGTNSSVRMPNPLLNASDITGFTVSMWVLRNDANAWDGIWGFFNSTSATAKSPRFYWNGNNHLGYNDNVSNWFDINRPDDSKPATQAYTDIPVGQWTLVTVTAGAESGVRIYVNGTVKAAHTVAASNGAAKVGELDAASLIKSVTGMKYFFLGLGSFWGSADCAVDDIMIFDRELSAVDVKSLSTMTNRVTDFGPQSEDAISPILAQPDAQHNDGRNMGIYDISGRRVLSTSRPGLYIIGGKKVLK